LFNFLNKKYFLQTLKAAVKRNVGSAATSDKLKSKMAKVCQCETQEAIPNTSGVSSEVQQLQKQLNRPLRKIKAWVSNYFPQNS